MGDEAVDLRVPVQYFTFFLALCVTWAQVGLVRNI